MNFFRFVLLCALTGAAFVSSSFASAPPSLPISTESAAPIDHMNILVGDAGNVSQLVPSTTLNTAQTLSFYFASLQAAGGTPGYSWSIASGSLPPGIFLAGNFLYGIPTTVGTFSFSMKVTDSSRPAQAVTATFSLIVTSALSVSTSPLSAGVVGTPYSVTMQAIGGVPAYTWYIVSGALPGGLTLSSATGTISGTPTASGTFTITAEATDSSSPRLGAVAPMSITVAPAQTKTQGPGSYWYVRPDGGTRYSTLMRLGQCDGTADVPYPGKGLNQHCAFNDVRLLWQDGSYTTTSDRSSFPAYGWIGSGGDTYIVRGSLGTGTSYRIGWNNQSRAYDAATGLYFGLQGDPYGSGIPLPLPGTSTQHTRILGENFAACHSASAKTQLHGGFGVGTVLNMAGASYVDVACFDVTDFSACGRSAQASACNTSIGSLSDFATNGINWSNTSTHDTLTDLHIHGLGNAGMIGPTGDGVVMSYIDLLGNPSSGWNADSGDGSTGTGSLQVSNYNISWNGCAEQYPIVNALPYADCTDDSSGGYGDGFGTATVASNPGWTVHFDQGVASYNTQDGLDALHLIGTGSSMTVTRTLAFGNMGQQIKVGGASGSASNNLIVTNCNALRQAIPGTPSGYNARLADFCRAADSGILLTLGQSSMLSFDDNTIYSASATAIDLECDTSKGKCDATSKIDFRNNVFLGFRNDSSHGYPAGGTGDYSNPVYNGTGTNPFVNQGSLYTNNLTWNAKSNWKCPASGEVNAICQDPGLTDETWHLFGFGDMSPAPGSRMVVGVGVSIPGITLDYAGQVRSNPPSIGAYEH